MTETISALKRKKDLLMMKALNSTFKIPFVKVDRDRFLKKTLHSLGCTEETVQHALRTSPVEVLTADELKRAALKVRKTHRSLLSGLSAVCGVPGGLFIFLAVPVDTIQFFYHTFVFSQKIAYLYGFPPCINETEFRNMMIIALGVGAGVNKANKAFKFMAKTAKKQFISQLQKHQELLLPQLLKEICKAMGVKLTNNTLTQIMRKGIPLISAVISAIFAYTVFSVESNRIIAAFENSVKEKTESVEDHHFDSSAEFLPEK